MVRVLCGFLLIALFGLCACSPFAGGSAATPTAKTTATKNPPMPPTSQGSKAQNTPSLKPTIAAPGNLAASGKDFWVTNPSTNAKLHVLVFFQEDTTVKQPAIILVPGGTADSGGLVQEAGQILQSGLIVVLFDPDGRGKSEGVEDYNGYKQQDGLAAVVRFTAALSQVDPARIGIATFSYGITMGSGALARYPDLPVRYLIDWEGPVDRNYTTTGCGPNRPGGIQWQACSNQAWWAEREAITFISKIHVPYQRIQSEKDHVQENNQHAIDIVNTAVKAGLAFVRLNDYAPNQTYDPKSPPKMLPDSQDRFLGQTVARYAQELLKR